MKKRYTRVLVKLSGEYLGGEKGSGFDFDIIGRLTAQICELHDLGYEIALVLGGGNFFRGTKHIPLAMDRVAADHIGMMATMMNGICLKESFISAGKPAKVMTGLRAPGIAESFSKERALSGMAGGEIMIFSGGTGNPFFSTDTAAVLRALEIGADIVIKGTKVDGVYDRDPVADSSAVKFHELTYAKVLELNLKVMDAPAIALCRENSLPLCVLSIANRSDLKDFLSGDPVGTLVGDGS